MQAADANEPAAIQVATRGLLIYHSAFGDLERAVESARYLIETAKAGPPASAMGAYRDASRAFWTAGLVTDALEALETAYSYATRIGLRRSSFQIAASLASFLIDTDRGLDRAKPWLLRTEEAVAELPDFRLSNEYITLRIQRALSEGNLDEARQYCAAFYTRPLNSTIGKRWMNRLALRTRQLSGDSPLWDISLDALVTAATNLPRQEIADTEIAIVVRALVARGLGSEAETILDDYVGRARLAKNPLDLALVREMRAVRKAPHGPRS
jgi:hypothetical protein